ncbi:hypothetical protein HY468_02920 [Candidatus Roizmanbacteria bacterium]|nr:hypothetical protein [Candidatus Roizmanbacteria bacterium]
MEKVKPIFVEAMHGFSRPVSDLQTELLPLSYGPLKELLQENVADQYRGLVKGPRGILTADTIQTLVRLGITNIAYVGRHTNNVLPEEFHSADDNVVCIQTDRADVFISRIQHSPLSYAVAAYVLGLSRLMYSGQIAAAHHLTISGGNTFSLRAGHSFIYDEVRGNALFSCLHVVSVGAGDIGSKVIEGFAEGGARVSYIAQTPKPSGHRFLSSLSDLDTSAPVDILTLHLPPGVKASLKTLENIDLFFHTASASNIDAEEIVEALSEGRIQRAIVDVFLQEGDAFAHSVLNPIGNLDDEEEKLQWKRELDGFIEKGRLLLTPHIAYNEPTMIAKTLQAVLANLCKLEDITSGKLELNTS